MANLADIYPKFKQDSIFLRTKEGVFFQRNDKFTFRLKGASIYQWITTLLPYMNGEKTLAEISAQLSPEQSKLIYQLVSTLLERGILKDEKRESTAVLSPNLREHFRPQIEFIDHYVDLPQERFQTFRNSRILLLGSGEAFLSLASVLLDNGLKEIFLSPEDQVTNYLPHLYTKVEQLNQQGLEAQITPVIDWQEAGQSARYDLIAYCSDTGSLRAVYELTRFAVKHEIMFVPALPYAGQVSIGPLVEPTQGPCWLCAQIRISTNSEPAHFTARWRDMLLGTDTPQPNLHTALARRMGNGLGFELFKLLTGALPTEIQQGVIFQDTETLESSYGKVSRYPYCPICTPSEADQGIQQLQEIASGQRDRQLDVSAIIERTQRLTNERTGIFQRFEDGHILQLPVKISRLTIHSPVAPTAKKLDITTYSVENVLDARYQAIQEGIKIYTRMLPKLHHQVSATSDALITDGKQAISPSSITTWSGVVQPDRMSHTSWIPGISLLDNHTAYLPAAAVYPETQLNRHNLFEKTTAGAAIGLTYAETARSGLVSALAHEQIHDLVRGRTTIIDLEPTLQEETDKDIVFLIQSLKHFECPCAIWEIVTNTPIHVTIALSKDEQTLENYAIGYGLTGREAAHQALLGLVGTIQLQQTNEPPSQCPTLLFPWFSVRSDFPQGEAENSRYYAPASSYEDLRNYLRTHKRDAFFVNTTTSDILETASFISAMIILAKAESDR